MTLRMMLVAMSVLVAQAAIACSITVTERPQSVVRRAEVIAEVVATSERDTFRVTKAWKGKPPEVIKTQVALDPCEPTPSIVDGGEYVLVLDDGQPGWVMSAWNAANLVKYMLNSHRLPTGDVLRMLRAWHVGKVTNAAMSLWLRDMAPAADVDDWAVYAGGDKEDSLVLHVLDRLNSGFHFRDVPLSERTCQLTVLRQRVAPVLIELLTNPPRTEEEAEAFEEKYPDFEDIEDQLCPDSSAASSS